MAKFEKFDNTVIQAKEFDAPTGKVATERFKLTPLHGLLVLFALAVLSFILFITLAKSVQIKAVATNLASPNQRIAQPASVSIKSLFKLPIGNRVLVLPGSYDVSVNAKGFQPLKQELEISDQRHQQIELLITRLPGKLKVSLQKEIESQATVYVDDEAVGTLPGIIEGIPAGKRKITIDAPLYRPFTQTLIVQGKEQVESLSVELQEAWAEYQFSSSPDNAKVFIDDEEVGDTSLQVKLEEGARQLKIIAAGFKPYLRNVSVVAEEDVVVPEVTLTPADGVIDLSTQPSNAAIILNGEYRGNSPMKLSVAPNKAQSLKIYKAGYRLLEQKVSLKPDQVETKQLSLKADLVAVDVNVSPSDAEVYVDGVKKGQGSLTLNLTTLPHTVSVRKAGYVTQNDALVPTPGQKQVVNVTLLTKEAHYWAQIPDDYTNAFGHTMKLFKAPGSVKLGSSRKEAGRRANEVQYNATLTKPFYVSLHETTNKQFRNFKAKHSSGNYKKKSLDLNSAPVVNVSWQQAALYCNWLSEKEDLDPFYQTKKGFVSGHNKGANGYRLLTEVEWAWLARNNSNSVLTYPWGSGTTPPEKAVGNFADQQSVDLITFTLNGYDDGYRGTAPVGRFPANHRGLFDMAGNASEWVHDWYDSKGNSTGNTTDPLGPKVGEFHVVRGASWAKGHLPQLRLAYRAFGAKGEHDVGFRIARYAGVTNTK